MWYNIFILQVPPMHHSERNLDVRVGIMPTIHPIYRRNNLENNLQNNGINFSKQPVVFENKPTIAITKAKAKARATAKATAKAITKENLSSCQADKPPRERSFLFLDRMILVKRRMAVQEAFALPWVHPLSFAFAQQLPQRWSRGRCAPGVYAHLGTGWNPGLRADAILPYGSSGEAGSIQPGCPRITATILSRTIIGQIVPVHIVLSEFYPFILTFLVNFSAK